MLIYNYKKEFIGIDKEDLGKFNLNNLEELKNESLDFADLFLRVPGHIHNFKSIHWIDFLKSSQSLDESKVIIEVNAKKYKANLELNTLYLVDEPSKMAYGVSLVNVRELTKEEEAKVLSDMATKSISTSYPNEEIVSKVFENAIPSSNQQFHTQNQAQEIDIPAKEETQTINEETTHQETFADTMYSNILKEEVPTPKEKEETPPQIEEVKEEEEKQHDDYKEYIYDPRIAAQELNLDLELIEEFVQDFIVQAKDFKERIYNALETGDMENLKALAHKLKGVASNLRIEDAFKALVVINTSDNLSEIKSHLDMLYNHILPKLSHGDEPALVQEQEESQNITQEIDLEDKENEDDEDKIDIILDDDNEEEIEEAKDEDKIELSIEDEKEEESFESKEEIEDNEERLDITFDDEDEEDDDEIELALSLDDEDLEKLEASEDEDELDILLKEGIELENEFDDDDDEEKITLDIDEDDEEIKLDNGEEITPKSDEDLNLEDEIKLDDKEDLELDEEIKLDDDDEDLKLDEEIKLDDEDLDLDKEIKLDDEEINLNEEENPSDTNKYNLKTLADKLDLDLDLFKEILSDFIQNSSQLLQKLQTQEVLSDDELRKSYLLKLKGMSDSMNLDEISSLYEKMIENPDEIKNIYPKIEQNLNNLNKLV